MQSEPNATPQNPIQIPLLQCTTKPLKYTTFSFGGDDELGFYQGCLPNDDPLIIRFLDIVKAYSKTEDPTKMAQLEEQHTKIRNETIRFVNTSKRGDDGHTKKVLELCDKRFANEKLRKRIVNALGGKEFCKEIPIIEPKNFDDYPHFELEDIPEGYSMAQYEDKAGRKGCLIKLKNKETGKLCLVWIFQRYRETCLTRHFWMMNGACNLEGEDEIVEFLYQILPKPHPKFELVV